MKQAFDAPLARIAESYKNGKVRARALAETVIENYRATGEACGAFKAWNPERMLAGADAADAVLAASGVMGPLHGIPVSIKDIYGVSGYPTFAGTPKELPEKWRREGPVVRALRRQLAVVTGKTHTVELAFGGIGANPHWDPPRNPWDADGHRVPGGSSSGAGVSLATGTALVALGTDTAGSVRIPASVTGNVGLKTSYGRWSTDGIVPLSPSLDTAGILARSVADLAYAFLALDPWSDPSQNAMTHAADRGVEGLRIGVAGDFFWEHCSPGVAEGVRGALGELVKKGARLISLPLPEVDIVTPIFRKGGLAAAELYAFLRTELPDRLEHIDPIVQQRMDEAATLPAHEYLERVRVLGEAAAAASDRLAAVDVLACPTVTASPPLLADVAEVEDYRQANLLILRNTAIVNYLGLCALTMPVALDGAGMPVGLQLIGQPGADDRIVQLALACEGVLGTGRERIGKPPLGV